MQEIDALVSEAADIEEALIRCEACLASVEQGPSDAGRICLVKCAIYRQLDNWPAQQEWTMAQRSRHAGLTAKAQALSLDVHLIDRLPPNDVDTVLSVTVQQAAQSPAWPEHLTQLMGLVEAWQSRGGMRDLALARSLLNCLGQALDQLHQTPLDQRAREAMGLIESRVCTALLNLVESHGMGKDLWSVANGVGETHTAPSTDGKVQAVDGTVQDDVLAVVRSLLRQAGLSFQWARPMTLETWTLDASVDDASRPGPKQQLAAVIRALVVLDAMHLHERHPSRDCLKCWLMRTVDALALSQLLRISTGFFQGCHLTGSLKKEAVVLTQLMERKLVGDEGKQAVLSLLSDPASTEADRAGLMEWFAKLLSSPETRRANLGWIIVNYAEHIDLLGVLAPIWEPTVPGEPLVSGIDRAVELARRLATDAEFLNRLRYDTQDMEAPTAEGWCHLLRFSRFYIDKKEKPADPFFGLDHGHDVHCFLHASTRYLDYPSRVAFFCDLWLSALVNGVHHHRLHRSFVLARYPFQLHVDAIWDRQQHARLLSLQRPSLRSGLDPDLQQHLLQRQLVKAALVPGGLVKKLVVANFRHPERWTDEDFTGFRLSVEEFLRRECETLASWVERRGDVAPEWDETDLRYYRSMATFWATVAKERPPWLLRVLSEHPWLSDLVDLAQAVGMDEDERGRAMARVVVRAAQEKTAIQLIG